MSPIDKLVSKLRRARALPLRMLASKLTGNVTAFASARLFLRGCSVGPRARTFGRPRIENGGRLTIGSDFALNCGFGTVHLAVAGGGELAIGDHVSINYGTSISARESVRLGDRVKIGPYCIVSDTDLPLPFDVAPDEVQQPIVIGSDVWLGARVIVLPGTTIGDGAVIAAGSIVGGQIPARAVASGVPARVLRINEAPVSELRVRPGSVRAVREGREGREGREAEEGLPGVATG